MTISKEYEYHCIKCGKINKVLTEDSITTWLYPDLVLKVFNDEYFFDCSNCNHKNRIVKDILVNTRKGMFNLDTGISLQKKRDLLIQYGVVDEKGNVLKQEIQPREEMQHDPSIATFVKNIEEVVGKFRDDVLKSDD